MGKVLIGKIVSASGIKGEVKVYNYADGFNIYKTVDHVFAGSEKKRIESIRFHKNMVIMKLEGINNRDAAEKARGLEVSISEDDLPPTAEGEFYVRDIIGMKVILEDGTVLGTLSDVIQNTAQDIFEFIREDGRKAMIPNVPEFIIKVNPDDRTIMVRIIEGMIED